MAQHVGYFALRRYAMTPRKRRFCLQGLSCIPVFVDKSHHNRRVVNDSKLWKERDIDSVNT